MAECDRTSRLAIYGPFSIENDKQHTAIAQDGQTAAMEHAGRTGGLPFVGVGWYRTTFSTPQMTKGGKCILLFDGAMSPCTRLCQRKRSRLLALRLQCFPD